VCIATLEGDRGYIVHVYTELPGDWAENVEYAFLSKVVDLLRSSRRGNDPRALCKGRKKNEATMNFYQ
jgi:hypothetical protein